MRDQPPGYYENEYDPYYDPMQQGECDLYDPHGAYEANEHHTGTNPPGQPTNVPVHPTTLESLHRQATERLEQEVQERNRREQEVRHDLSQTLLAFQQQAQHGQTMTIEVINNWVTTMTQQMRQAFNEGLDHLRAEFRAQQEYAHQRTTALEGAVTEWHGRVPHDFWDRYTADRVATGERWVKICEHQENLARRMAEWEAQDWVSPSVEARLGALEGHLRTAQGEVERGREFQIYIREQVANLEGAHAVTRNEANHHGEALRELREQADRTNAAQAAAR